MDGTPITPDTKKAIVLIHGWTAQEVSALPIGYDAYQVGDAWFYLYNILKQKLAGSDWSLVAYHWEKDASTGGGVISAYQNATNAAINSAVHGQYLASLLDGMAPNLREVQFIAHSAGSWAAREAMRLLLQKNPYVVAQLTILDPFIPDANFGYLTGLSKYAMSDMAAQPMNRISHLENYFAYDEIWNPSIDLDLSELRVSFQAKSFTISTQEEFTWRSDDINQPVDNGYTPFLFHLYYDYHGGPIEFYADTVKATIPGETIEAGLVDLPNSVSHTDVGYYRSLAYEGAIVLPRITAQPQGQSVMIGSNISLSVTANRTTSYQWYKNKALLAGQTSSTLLVNNATTADSGDYVVRLSNSNNSNHSLVFSDIARVAVTSAPIPTISSVSPRILNTQPVGQVQQITITGTNFTSSSTLTFNNGSTDFTGRVPIFDSPTQLRYSIGVGPKGAFNFPLIC